MPRPSARSALVMHSHTTALKRRASTRTPGGSTVPSMTKKAAATKADRVAVARLVLDGLAHGEPLDNVLGRLHAFADYRFPFPGDVLTEIAAGALDLAGASRATPLSLSDATERH